MGFASTAAVVAVFVLVSGVVSVVLPQAGLLPLAVRAVSGVALVAAVVIVFRNVRGRRVAWLFLPIALLVASAAFPGGVEFLAVVIVALSVVFVVFVTAHAVVQSRAFALLIVALPVIGSGFYVPKAIDRAGLVPAFGAESTAPATPVTQRLALASQAVFQATPDATVLVHEVVGNRLYLHVATQTVTRTLEVDATPLVKTPIRWLERSLERQVAALADAPDGPSGQAFARVLGPSIASLGAQSTVVVADGALVNLAHQPLLENSRVFRAVALDGPRIARNIADWDAGQVVRPEDLTVINALPASSTELANLGLAGDSWNRWQGWSERFTSAATTPDGISAGTTSATRAATLEAFRTKRTVLIVVAHADGFSIRLPNGEALQLADLDAVKDAIRANRPQVFFFSCHTARVRGLESFAKTLLDYGASAVVAPLGRLSAGEALDVFRTLLGRTLAPASIPLGAAFEEAIKDFGRRSMEVWVAQTEVQRPVSAASASRSDFVVRPQG